MIRGVLRISQVGGLEETCQDSGAFDRGKIRVSHRDGDSFRGTLRPDGTLAGFLRMRNGQEISVKLSQHLEDLLGPEPKEKRLPGDISEVAGVAHQRIRHHRLGFIGSRHLRENASSSTALGIS